MRLAILMTNTDESAFAHAHPRDGQKFSELLWGVRPDWAFEVFSIKDGIFPRTLNFDGLLITGSPASVHDEEAWIPKLEGLVREAVEKRLPLFGACFGHQVIAKALGSDIIPNPDGWVLGRIETQFMGKTSPVPFYAAHKEQVASLPQDAQLVARTQGCEIAGFAINKHVLTTQYHPEMTGSFIAALLDAFADEIGHHVAKKAAASLTEETDVNALAEWIANFYEQAAL